MIVIDSPPDCTYELIAGFGPMNAASTSPEFMASMAVGPVEKTWVLSSVLPSASSKIPSWTPASAGPCVRLAK